MSPSHPVLSSPPHSQHGRLLLPALLVGVVVAAILLAHGAAWWSAPLAVAVAVVLAHLLALGLIIGVGVAMTGGGDHEGAPRGALIHRPRLYDWMVRALAGGREAAMRASWLELADVGRGDAVLDVGCGTGTLLLAAAARVGSEGTLAGIEAAPEMVKRARVKIRAAGVAVEIHQGSADVLPFADRSFDVVFATLVFHHLPADVQLGALQEMRRVLRPGGRVVIVDLPHGHSHEHGHGRGHGLFSMIHSGAAGRLVDLDGELAKLGASEVTHQGAGMRALQATRAIFAEAGPLR
ncbi:MAG: class I SAM-dependent methyltransferase [Myxococcales bacterium]|nr:class I SAM-dependent methyltransferase [Myxococcales bacterium]